MFVILTSAWDILPKYARGTEIKACGTIPKYLKNVPDRLLACFQASNIPELLCPLHCFSEKQKINFKILVLTCKTFSGPAPAHKHKIFSPTALQIAVHSSSTTEYQHPKELPLFFALHIWNALPISSPLTQDKFFYTQMPLWDTAACTSPLLI